MTSRWLLVAVLLSGCVTRSGFLVTAKPLDGLCLALPAGGSETVQYWDPGKDCSERYSSIGVSQAVTDSSTGTVRFDIPLHRGVAHIGVRITGNGVQSLGTGAEETLEEHATVPPSLIDRYVAR